MYTYIYISLSLSRSLFLPLSIHLSVHLYVYIYICMHICTCLDPQIYIDSYTQVRSTFTNLGRISAWFLFRSHPGRGMTSRVQVLCVTQPRQMGMSSVGASIITSMVSYSSYSRGPIPHLYLKRILVIIQAYIRASGLQTSFPGLPNALNN